MPRPHIPHHLSLQRIKNPNPNNHNSSAPNPASVPSTPPAHSRNQSPTRSSNVAGPTSADGAGRGGDHKGMGLVLRVQVQKARNLAPKDKSGTSDPYLILTLGESKEATSVVSKTLNPEWNQTFEFPVTTADSALLEVICWDKDRFKKDYMGDFDVVLEDVFQNSRTSPEPRWFKLESRRAGRRKKKSAEVTGEVLLKFTLFDPVNTAATEQQILQKFSGVVGSGGDDDDDEDDDELLSRLTSRELEDVDEEGSDEEEDKDSPDESDSGIKTPGDTVDDKAQRRRDKKIRKLKRKNKLKAYEFSGMSDVAGVLFLEINRITDLPPEKNSTRTTFDMDPFVVTSLGKKTYRTRVVNHNLNPVYDEKLVFQVQKHEAHYHLSFAVVDRDKFSGNDFVGTATFPVDKVAELSPEADSETGLYKLPDPDTVSGDDVMQSQDNLSKRKRMRWPLSRSSSQTNMSRNSSSSNLQKLTRTTSSNSLKGDQLSPGGGGESRPMRPGVRRMESENDVSDQLTSPSSQQQRPGPTSAPSYGFPKATANNDAKNGPSANGGVGQSEDRDMYPYEIPLELKNKQRWQDKHNPVLYIRAKYLPYRALRQQFWRAMLKQYDADESGKIDKVELTTMLDTLGSTLHNSTIDGFFARWADENEKSGIATGGDKGGVMTMDQAVICLEEQLTKSNETQSHMHRPHWDRSESAWSTANQSSGLLTPGRQHSSPDESPGGGTPYLAPADHGKDRSPNTPGSLPSNFNPSSTSIPALEVSDVSDSDARSALQPQDGAPKGPDKTPAAPNLSPQLSRSDSWGQDSEADLADEAGREEHVVEIAECPICHMPRLNARGKRGKNGKRKRQTTDADIITHIATCASSDWRAVNNLVMAGFVTSSQAQRKWYSKVVTKISYGGYRLGANSANILVQDRITGMINEERMSVYVRIGIRLLYKGLKSNSMEGRRSRSSLNDGPTSSPHTTPPGTPTLPPLSRTQSAASQARRMVYGVSRLSTSAAHSVTSVRKLLRSMSVKQGKKYDDPASASQIAGFINFHQLDMSEVLLPTESFKTFNQFFYRKLKPDARPCSAPENPHIIVSPADCRSVVFNRLEEAQRIWVKGREFSVERLLGDAYPDDAKRYKGGALGIMRLAPQDYHRFHIPVDGVMREPKLIEGEYYTVNPMAIRSALDVYGENIRVCVPIDSVAHGRVMVICVGAMMVGSTVITRKNGEEVKRAEELGYFKFGGSTLLLLFEPGVMRFDEDLVANAGGALETLIRVGMSIGHSPQQEPHRPDMQKANPTAEEKQEAKRRIEGSLAPSKGVDAMAMGGI
ncbi:phosphatidylserine decarboxylase [Saxophila tyrrhenica]|uniref:phosphatidylserine decarboxylase n=1 Tax=Saxophila tyrrhenica TaxID=1690608 RepID=A0AAV9PA49_9PEZI|nr:phosphatidylserine decarboxylase [Saxophila tyrrhenica]